MENIILDYKVRVELPKSNWSSFLEFTTRFSTLVSRWFVPYSIYENSVLFHKVNRIYISKTKINDTILEIKNPVLTYKNCNFYIGCQIKDDQLDPFIRVFKELSNIQVSTKFLVQTIYKEEFQEFISDSYKIYKEVQSLAKFKLKSSKSLVFLDQTFFPIKHVTIPRDIKEFISRINSLKRKELKFRDTILRFTKTQVILENCKFKLNEKSFKHICRIISQTPKELVKNLEETNLETS